LNALKGSEDIDLRTLDEEGPDLKVTDRLVNVAPEPNADFPQILKFAARREKITYDFYIQLAEGFKGTQWAKLIRSFALEELNHKKLIEEEYEEITGW